MFLSGVLTRGVFVYNNRFIFIYNYKELLCILKWWNESINPKRNESPFLKKS